MQAINSATLNLTFLPSRDSSLAKDTLLGYEIKSTWVELKLFFSDLFQVIAQVFAERLFFGKVFKLSIHLLTGLACIRGNTFQGTRLLGALSAADSLLTLGDLAVDANDLVNKRYLEIEENSKSKKVFNKCSLFASIGSFVADIGGLFLWLDELALINLLKIKATVGRNFSKLANSNKKLLTYLTNCLRKMSPMVAKISLVIGLQGVEALAILCLSVNEFKHLANVVGSKPTYKIALSIINLASYIAEITLKILAITGHITVPGIAAMGCAAAGCGLAAFLLEAIYNYRLVNLQSKRPDAGSWITP
ncbi:MULTISPECIES: hypothetical protein [unclassified Neochlamydia]|uniref:hypothetical protein n=1 Tax=unclassified Neochlamydia TaxID=2643326 RepID=UPI00140917CC|nr:MULTISPECIES: hypothetical protein [unclassified Neochlamydia]MBS4167377.1 Uncharacterized protein [Neochlamydia sp. AcF65]MBS4169631.1 Uncharacterized protein [Neochlamydia sp. AcF95]NGY95451.1 hypothetical protein [Neochlamydia sp. AcF84]